MIKEKRTGYEFKTKPWKHQIKALMFLMQQGSGALFLDMGTGKSKIVCDWIHNSDARKILILAPKRVCHVWQEQTERHLIDHDAWPLVLLHDGSVPKRAITLANIARTEPMYIAVINYDSVWRPGLCQEVMKLKWDAVICDESHRIKAASSQVSKFMAKLGPKVNHRIILTGTPLAQTPLDIFGQYRFLDPTIYGTNYYKFRDQYEVVDVARSTQMGFRMRDKINPWKNLDDLQAKMFSRAYAVKVVQNLPERHHIMWSYPADKKTEAAYNELIKKHVVYLEEGVLTVEYIVTLTGRLQQILGGCIPVEDRETGASVKTRFSNERVEQFLEILEGLAPDEPVVVFAKYKDDIDAIAAALAKAKITYSELHGRRDTFAEWKAGNTRILIAQPQSGSEGVDMVRARYVVYYSKNHSLSQYNQSVKRVHRPGQTRNVTYYHLICDTKSHQSIDRIIQAALDSGQRVIDSIIDMGGKF